LLSLCPVPDKLELRDHFDDLLQAVVHLIGRLLPDAENGKIAYPMPRRTT
jgi:hypothetical protein